MSIFAYSEGKKAWERDSVPACACARKYLITRCQLLYDNYKSAYRHEDEASQLLCAVIDAAQTYFIKTIIPGLLIVFVVRKITNDNNWHWIMTTLSIS